MRSQNLGTFDRTLAVTMHLLTEFPREGQQAGPGLSYVLMCGVSRQKRSSREHKRRKKDHISFHDRNNRKRVVCTGPGRQGRQSMQQSGWLQSGKKKEESAFLTHVISGLFKSPPSTKVTPIAGLLCTCAVQSSHCQ